MAKAFDARATQKNREDRNRKRGLQFLICNGPGRFHVSRGNVVANGLTRWGYP
jgi:hypothetical protein